MFIAAFLLVCAHYCTGRVYYCAKAVFIKALCNALCSADPQTYWAIRGQLDGRVEADLNANNAYWDQFTGKLEQAAKQASNTVYNGFLQSYGEADGTKTYGKCVDLLVAYYFDYRTQ